MMTNYAISCGFIYASKSLLNHKDSQAQKKIRQMFKIVIIAEFFSVLYLSKKYKVNMLLKYTSLHELGYRFKTNLYLKQNSLFMWK